MTEPKVPPTAGAVELAISSANCGSWAIANIGCET
jgi:hypothetical protein